MAAPSDTKLPPTLSSPPPAVPDTVVSFPEPHVLLVRLNRPRQLNAIPRPQHFALARLWRWYDGEASLRCAVLTGTGRAFCAGQDLKEWNSINHEDGSSSGSAATSSSGEEGGGGGGRMPADGFGGLSNRAGKKPVVAAVNGLCLGGGMEMAINCDLVVAAAGATFGLPEVTIGVIALAGALPRLVRSVGRQRAAEMALGGRAGYGADEMLRWGLVNEVVPASSSSSFSSSATAASASGDTAVVDAALAWARRIAANSPDAVIVSREGLKLGWEGVGPAQATDLVANGWYARIEKGENFVEGVKSFNERRKPVWKDSKL